MKSKAHGHREFYADVRDDDKGYMVAGVIHYCKAQPDKVLTDAIDAIFIEHRTMVTGEGVNEFHLEYPQQVRLPPGANDTPRKPRGGCMVEVDQKTKKSDCEILVEAGKMTIFIGDDCGGINVNADGTYGGWFTHDHINVDLGTMTKNDGCFSNEHARLCAVFYEQS
jgi:hypothetical protein